MYLVGMEKSQEFLSITVFYKGMPCFFFVINCKSDILSICVNYVWMFLCSKWQSWKHLYRVYTRFWYSTKFTVDKKPTIGSTEKQVRWGSQWNDNLDWWHDRNIQLRTLSSANWQCWDIIVSTLWTIRI